jgi:hypothetical protein
VKQPWAWVVGLVVLVVASPVLICLLRAVVLPVVVIALVAIAVRLSFHYTCERW